MTSRTSTVLLATAASSVPRCTRSRHPPRISTRCFSSSSTSSSSSSSSTTQTFHTKQGRVKVDLTRPQLIGVHQSRGERPYQEDTYSVQGLLLDAGEVQRSLTQLEGYSQSPSSSSSSSTASPSSASASTGNDGNAAEQEQEQAVYVAVFDGHNGSSVSTFLKDKLHERITSYARENVEDTVGRYRDLGGYMRRYKAGILGEMVEQIPRSRAMQQQLKEKKERERLEREQAGKDAKKKKKEVKPWSIHQRILASFLEADLEIIAEEKEAGAVSTIALLHSLDQPRSPFFSSSSLHLLIAHLGDTRALLCTAPGGEAVILTEKHHPDARSETERLMRTRTGAVTDSFGESRWAGTLANTRGFGDAHYKELGVFAEPAITSRILTGSEYAFLILLSDGVTDVISDQEICDLVRGHKDPRGAARNVVGFAESIGASDNLTCVIVPLPGWGNITSEDSTKKRREFRMENYEGRSNRQDRM